MVFRGLLGREPYLAIRGTDRSPAHFVLLCCKVYHNLAELSIICRHAY